MNRVPSNLSLDRIVGSFLTQLRVGQYDLQFTFGDVDFIVESEVSLIRNGRRIGFWKGGRWPSTEFYEIMNTNVVEYSIPDERTIIILLDNGIEITLRDNSEVYESIRVSIGKDQWII